MRHTTIVRLAFLLSIPIPFSFAPGAPTAKQPAEPPPATQPPVQSDATLPQLSIDPNTILHHLNQVISLYRQTTTGIRDVGLPSDAIYQDNAKSLGAQAVQLAFQSAKAEGVLVSGPKNAPTSQGSTGSTQQQNLEQLHNKTTAQISQIESQIEALDAKVRKTPASRRTPLVAQRDALGGELEVQKSLLDAIQKMADFVHTNGEAAGGLEGDINRLAQSVPEVVNHPNTDKTADSSATP